MLYFVETTHEAAETVIFRKYVPVDIDIIPSKRHDTYDQVSYEASVLRYKYSSTVCSVRYRPYSYDTFQVHTTDPRIA